MLLDFTGGVFSLLQMFLISYNYGGRRGGRRGEGLVVGTQREGLGVGGVEVYKGLRGVRGHLRLYGVDIAFWVCFIFLEVTFCADVGYHN